MNSLDASIQVVEAWFWTQNHDPVAALSGRRGSGSGSALGESSQRDVEQLQTEYLRAEGSTDQKRGSLNRTLRSKTLREQNRVSQNLDSAVWQDLNSINQPK